MQIKGLSGTLGSGSLYTGQVQKPTKEEIEELNTELSETVAEKLLSEKDENGDGVLSIEELGLSEETFEALDTEVEGYATVEELANYIKTQLGEKMEEMKPPTDEIPPEGPPPEEGGEGGPEAMISEILEDMGISDEDTETIMELLQETTLYIEA